MQIGSALSSIVLLPTRPPCTQVPSSFPVSPADASTRAARHGPARFCCWWRCGDTVLTVAGEQLPGRLVVVGSFASPIPDPWIPVSQPATANRDLEREGQRSGRTGLAFSVPCFSNPRRPLRRRDGGRNSGHYDRQHGPGRTPYRALKRYHRGGRQGGRVDGAAWVLPGNPQSGDPRWLFRPSTGTCICHICIHPTAPTAPTAPNGGQVFRVVVLDGTHGYSLAGARHLAT